MTSPSELRSVFGRNLRKLAAQYPSVAGLCRELAVNRTQFNRYLSGESFPRPDVLHRICTFFDLDARILLEPVEHITKDSSAFFGHPVIRDFLGQSGETVSESQFPNGFYCFSRQSFVEKELFAFGLLYVFRKDGQTFMRGYEPKAAMHIQGMDTSPIQREFRGAVLKQESGISLLAARRGATTCSFSYLSPVASFSDNFWEGYTTRTIAESLSSRRAARLVYEHLGSNYSAAFNVARQRGFVEISDLPPFHTRLLRLTEPFR